MLPDPREDRQCPAPWRFPAATALFTAACLLVFALGAPAFDALSLDRQAVADGQWYRLLSGHLVHVNASHLVCDLLVFAVLGSMIERFGRLTWLLGWLASAVVVSLTVLWLRPGVGVYVGMSGIDTALFAAVAVTWIAEGGARRLVGAVALAGLLGKTAYESLTGQTLFATMPDGAVPVPAAHLAGGLVGMVWASAHLMLSKRSARQRVNPLRSAEEVAVS